MKFLEYTIKEKNFKLPVEKKSIINAILLTGFIPTKENENIYCKCFNWKYTKDYTFIDIKTGDIYYSSNTDFDENSIIRSHITSLAKVEIADICALAVQLQLGIKANHEHLKYYKKEQGRWVDLLPKGIKFNLEGIPTDLFYGSDRHSSYSRRSKTHLHFFGWW